MCMKETSKHQILMRISKENDPTEKFAATLRKTIENIKADPTNPVNIELTRILSNFKDELDILEKKRSNC